MHDNAGSAVLARCTTGAIAADKPGCAGLNPRMVSAAASPRANNVIAVSATLAMDFSARKSVMSTHTPKNPVTAKVSHIGKVGERQSWSSDAAQAQFMRDIPQRSIERIHSM